MADKLDIRVNVEGNNQTVSKFAAAENGHVTFYNDAGAKLTISFGNASPLCQGSTPQLTFDVAAGQHKQLKVCNGVEGDTFKYTATVAGATPEDPPIILGKPIIIYDKIVDPVALAVGGTGLLIGLLAGYLIARRMMPRSKSGM
jgi:hypothetical protein